MGFLHHETLGVGWVGEQIGADEAVSLQGAIHILGDASCKPELPPFRHGFGINEITGVFGGRDIDYLGRLLFEQGIE
ncbi:hypothetical protein D3C76_1801120 [compost metagenome]